MAKYVVFCIACKALGYTWKVNHDQALSSYFCTIQRRKGVVVLDDLYLLFQN